MHTEGRKEEVQVAARRIRHTAVMILTAMVVVVPAVAITPAYVVLKEGDNLALSTVASLGPAYVNGNGKVGFVGTLADEQRFVWFDTGTSFLSNSAQPNTLAGHEPSMGISNSGGFIYSPSFNGKDSVYTHNGKLLAAGDAAPTLPGRFSTFNMQPRMLDDGTAVWVGGTSTSAGGATSAEAAWRCSDTANLNSCTTDLRSSQLVDGVQITAGGLNFSFDYSGNGLHHIHQIFVNSALANDNRLWVDGSTVAIEGTHTGGGDNWLDFGNVSINNFGDYVFRADTSSAVTMDEVLAFNGLIKVREGNVVDGKTLGSNLYETSINNLGTVAAVWSSSSTETLFVWPNIQSAPLAGLALLSVNDTIDVNNDATADYTIMDINTPSQFEQDSGLDLGDDGYIYVNVDMRPVGGGATVQAVIRLTPEPASMLLIAISTLALSRRSRR